MAGESRARYPHRFEQSVTLPASSEQVFEVLDDHNALTSHMAARGSFLMGGGAMSTTFDAGAGKVGGSHIRMTGTAFGLKLSVDEVVIERTVPIRKVWATVHQDLVVIGPYAMGFTLDSIGPDCTLTVWIEYAMPEQRSWLGRLLGGFYARWCVRQMIAAATSQFPRA